MGVLRPFLYLSLSVQHAFESHFSVSSASISHFQQQWKLLHHTPLFHSRRNSFGLCVAMLHHPTFHFLRLSLASSSLLRTLISRFSSVFFSLSPSILFSSSLFLFFIFSYEFGLVRLRKWWTWIFRWWGMASSMKILWWRAALSEVFLPRWRWSRGLRRLRTLLRSWSWILLALEVAYIGFRRGSLSCSFTNVHVVVHVGITSLMKTQIIIEELENSIWCYNFCNPIIIKFNFCIMLNFVLCL